MTLETAQNCYLAASTFGLGYALTHWNKQGILNAISRIALLAMTLSGAVLTAKVVL